MEPVAIKEIDLSKPTAAVLYKTEVKALRRLPEHANLPKIVGNCKGSATASIVLNYFPYPTLQSFLRERGSIPSSAAFFILRQLVRFHY